MVKHRNYPGISCVIMFMLMSSFSWAQRLEVLELETVTTKSCEESLRQGKEDAKKKRPAIWGVAGAGSVCLPSGTFIVPVLAMNIDEAPQAHPDGVIVECYDVGYAKEYNKRKIYAIIIGEAASVAVLTVGYIALYAAFITATL